MRIEAPVLNRDEGLRQIGRQRANRHVGASHLAARGDFGAVQPDDMHSGRALGNLQRLNGGQMRADPDDNADDGNDEPQRRHHAPIDEPSDARTFFSALRFVAPLLRRLARRLRLFVILWFAGGAGTLRSALAARCGAIIRREVEIRQAESALETRLATSP